MNCYCSPPLPVQQRTVTKSGNNFGKIFFNCSQSQCKFFCWMDDTMNQKLYTTKKNYSTTANSNSSSYPTAMNSSSSSSSSFVAAPSSSSSSNSTNSSKGTNMKLMIGEFESGPPFRVWFDVQCPMDAKIKAFFNTIPPDKKKLNSKTKMWSFNFEIYEHFLSTLLSSEYRDFIQVVEIPRFLINGIKKFLSVEIVPQEISLLGHMMDTILPFQLEAVEYVVRRGGRAMIADEMGCGKTIEAIAVLQQYRQHLPALILCPPCLTSQWREELLKYCDEMLEPGDLCSLTTSTDRIYGKACIMPYSLLDRFVNTFSEERRFGIVIADESHNLKSKDAKRTCLALPLLKNAQVALCLTGTPAVNRPVELYTQLHGLLPEVFRDYDGFTRRYCDPKKGKFGPKMDVSGSSNEAELKNILEGMVMIRRLKSDVINNLPTKSREVRRVKPDPEYIGPLNALQEEMRKTKATLYHSSSSDSNEFLNNQSRLLLSKLCGITGMSKISKVVIELEKLIEEAREARRNDLEEEKEVDVEIPNSRIETHDLESNFELPVQLGRIETDFISEQKNPIVDLSIDRHSPVIESNNNTDNKINENQCNDNSKSVELIDIIPEAEDEGLIDSDDEKVKEKVKEKVHSTAKKRKLPSIDSYQEEDGDHDADQDQDQGVSAVAEDENDDDDDIFFCRKPIGMKPKKAKVGKKRVEVIDSSDFEEERQGDWRNILDFSHAKVATSKPKSKRKKAEKQEVDGTIPVKPLGKKILVFAHHHDVLDAIESCVRRKGVGSIRVDGTVTGSARTNLISRFQKDPEIDVAILSITACGTGLNLTCANVALFAELHWSAGYMLQAEDRIHRLGQQSKNVKIIYILAEGTSDDIVWEQILKKHKILAATVGVDGSSMYASQKIYVKDVKNPSPPSSKESAHEIPDQSQTTLDAYMLPRSENVLSKEEHLKKASTPTKQQVSIESFLSKKSPKEETIPKLEMIDNSFTSTSTSTSTLPNNRNLNQPYSSKTINTPATVSPHFPSPAPTRSQISHNFSDFNLVPDSLPNCLESTRRFESKSSPTDLSLLHPHPHLQSHSLPLPLPPPAMPPPTSTSPGELSPTTKAKIEANRLRALAKRNQKLTQPAANQPQPNILAPTSSSIQMEGLYNQQGQSHALTNNTSNNNIQFSRYEQNPPPLPLQPPPLYPVSVLPSPSMAYSEKINHVVEQNRNSASFSGDRNGGGGHIFSTGAGNSLKITQDAIEKAHNLISNTANGMKKQRSID